MIFRMIEIIEKWEHTGGKQNVCGCYLVFTNVYGIFDNIMILYW